MTNCSESRVAVLVTSGNPTFREYNARRKLLDQLQALEAELHKAARPSK